MSVQTVENNVDGGSKTVLPIPSTGEEKRERVFLPTNPTDSFLAILPIALLTLGASPTHMLPKPQRNTLPCDSRAWLQLMTELVR